MISKRIFYLSLLIFVFCSGSVFAKDAPNLGYEKSSFEKHGAFYNVTAAYPKITDKLLSLDTRQKINNEIEQYVHKLMNDDLKAFIKGDSQYTKEEIKEIAWRNTLEISFKVIRFDDHFISIRFEKYRFEGGPHGVTDVYGFNYDIKRMSLVRLVDLFDPGTDYLRQLSGYCIKDLKRQWEPNPVGANWIMEGAAPKEEKLQEFAIGKNNLMIYFSEGQVDAYIAGTQKVKIPFKTLTGLKEAFVAVSAQDKVTKNNSSDARVSGDVNVSAVHRKGF